MALSIHECYGKNFSNLALNQNNSKDIMRPGEAALSTTKNVSERTPLRFAWQFPHLESRRYTHIPHLTRHMRRRHQNKRIIHWLSRTRPNLAQHIHWFILHIQQQNQPIAKLDPVDRLAAKHIFTRKNSAVGLQIAANLSQV